MENINEIISTVKPTYKQPQVRPKKVAYMQGCLYPDRVKILILFEILFIKLQ